MNRILVQLPLTIRDFNIINDKECRICLENNEIEVILYKNSETSRMKIIRSIEIEDPNLYDSLKSLSLKYPQLSKKTELIAKVEHNTEGMPKIEHYHSEITIRAELNRLVYSNYKELLKFGKDILNTIFWRYQLLVIPNPISVHNLQVSINNGKDWIEFSPPMHLSIDEGQGKFFKPEDLEVIKNSIQNNDEKFAIGFELWREAWRSRHDNRRSSWLLAISALEASVVTYISSSYTEAGWLISELPKPYLIKIFNKYFPTLADDKHEIQFFPLHKEFNRILNKGINKRNFITHTGEGIDSNDDLESLLLVCKDLLNMIDYHFGHKWALDYISDATKEKYNLTIKQE